MNYHRLQKPASLQDTKKYLSGCPGLANFLAGQVTFFHLLTVGKSSGKSSS